MGIMAVSTEEIGSLAGPGKVSRSFPMNARPPISVLGAMTLPAESIALREVYKLPIVEPQFISISYIMTIETPSHGLGMMKLNLSVFFFQFPFFSIYLHGGMAVTTGKHSLCHGKRSNRKLFACPLCKGRKTDS
jgi:hypothetical protein